MCIYVMNSKKLCISKLQLWENFIFWQTSCKKVRVLRIFGKIIMHLHVNCKYLYIEKKKISHEKILYWWYSVKYFSIYHAIQQSNVRKCYILTILIVKTLEFSRFRGIITYLCYPIAKEREKNVHFKKSGVALTQLSLTLHCSRRIFYYLFYIHV